MASRAASRCAGFIAKRFDGKASQFFGLLPRARFAIKPVPDDLAPFYTAGRGCTLPGAFLTAGQDSTLTGANEPAPALRTQQRHPHREPMASSVSGGPRKGGRVWVQLRPLTREGDVQGDVGRSCCVRMRIPDCVTCRALSAAGTAS